MDETTTTGCGCGALTPCEAACPANTNIEAGTGTWETINLLEACGNACQNGFNIWEVWCSKYNKNRRNIPGIMYGMFDPDTIRQQRMNPTGKFDFNMLGIKAPRGIDFVLSTNGKGVEWGEVEQTDLNTCTVGESTEPTTEVPVQNALNFAVGEYVLGQFRDDCDSCCTTEIYEKIVAVDYATNVITLANPVSFCDCDAIVSMGMRYECGDTIQGKSWRVEPKKHFVPFTIYGTKICVEESELNKCYPMYGGQGGIKSIIWERAATSIITGILDPMSKDFYWRRDLDPLTGKVKGYGVITGMEGIEAETGIEKNFDLSCHCGDDAKVQALLKHFRLAIKCGRWWDIHLRMNSCAYDCRSDLRTAFLRHDGSCCTPQGDPQRDTIKIADTYQVRVNGSYVKPMLDTALDDVYTKGDKTIMMPGDMRGFAVPKYLVSQDGFSNMGMQNNPNKFVLKRVHKSEDEVSCDECFAGHFKGAFYFPGLGTEEYKMFTGLCA